MPFLLNELKAIIESDTFAFSIKTLSSDSSNS